MKNKIKAIVLLVLMVVSAAGIAFTVKDAATKEKLPGMNSAERTNQPIAENSLPQNEPPAIPDSAVPNENGGEKMLNGGDFKQTENRLTSVHIALIAVFSIVFSASLLYILLSIRNRRFIKNRDKAIIFVLSIALFSSYLTAGISAVTNSFMKNSRGIEQTQTEKDKVDLDKNNSVNAQQIDLNSQNTDVTITKGGSYEISGSFNHSVIIDAENEDVEILLNNVEITNEKTAAIIGLAAKSLTVQLSDGSENTLSDGGNSEYDGCIFSNCELIFTGNGKLTVNGNQNEGEGIATEAADITINSGTFVITSNDDGINAGGDGAEITVNGGNIYVNASGDGIDSNKNAVINGGMVFVIGSDTGGDSGIDTDLGYTINGGTVVALGSDMIELPENSSKQNTVAFTLNQNIARDTLVSLWTGEEAVISFIAPKGFKTIIISSDKIVGGDYRLYSADTGNAQNQYGISAEIHTDKNSVSVNNQEVFSVSSSVQLFGSRQ